MQLEKLKIRNLYGFMDKTIVFNSNLNLLVGINGSGKTSVLNVISWLLNPAYAELCSVEYDELALDFIYQEKKHKIVCKQTKDNITLNLTVDKKKFNELTVQLAYSAQYLSNIKGKGVKQRLIQHYRGLEPTFTERETWNYFLQLPKPTVISIDRDFEKHKSNADIFDNDKPISDNSLEIVKRYSNSAYARYNKMIIDLNKSLRNRVLLSSFESSIIDVSSYNRRLNVQISDVNALEEKFVKFLEQDELNSSNSETISDLKNAISSYTDSMRSIIVDYNKSNKKDSNNPSARINTAYILNSNQFVRIRKLLDDFSKYESDSLDAFKEVSNYLDAVNHFLVDSNKELYFKKEDGQLYFRLRNKNEVNIKNEQSIDNLSSGERQILILLTYLAFGNIKNKIVIIDEPEISLHPKWQDDFLQQISNVTPINTQLIIATHSPSIVGDLEEVCKVLLPYNE